MHLWSAYDGQDTTLSALYILILTRTLSESRNGPLGSSECLHWKHLDAGWRERSVKPGAKRQMVPGFYDAMTLNLTH